MTPRPIVRSTPRRALERLLAAGIDPLLARLDAARGIEHPAETEAALARLLPPEAMKGTREAAELLAEAIDAQARIVVIGDYYCAGATATDVAVRALRAMGAHVDLLVHNRFTYGYGLSPEIVALAAERFAPFPPSALTMETGRPAIWARRVVSSRRLTPCPVPML